MFSLQPQGKSLVIHQHESAVNHSQDNTALPVPKGSGMHPLPPGPPREQAGDTRTLIPALGNSNDISHPRNTGLTGNK